MEPSWQSWHDMMSTEVATDSLSITLHVFFSIIASWNDAVSSCIDAVMHPTCRYVQSMTWSFHTQLHKSWILAHGCISEIVRSCYHRNALPALYSSHISTPPLVWFHFFSGAVAVDLYPQIHGSVSFRHHPSWMYQLHAVFVAEPLRLQGHLSPLSVAFHASQRLKQGWCASSSACSALLWSNHRLSPWSGSYIRRFSLMLVKLNVCSTWLIHNPCMQRLQTQCANQSIMNASWRHHHNSMLCLCKLRWYVSWHHLCCQLTCKKSHVWFPECLHACNVNTQHISTLLASAMWLWHSSAAS